MKNICRMVLLAAGIVLSLAGCQKSNTPGELTGKAVKFNATTGSIMTRTSFTGDGTSTGTDDFGRKILSHERINWEIGDQIMIASDYATVLNSTTKYATYKVATMTENGDKSYATLYEKAGTEELFFNDEHAKYKFWGIYPASAGSGTSLVNAQASYAIDASQAPVGTPKTTNHTINNKAVTLTTLAPDMTKAVMLAAAEDQTSESVELDFYPGFTAFEFTLNSRDAELVLTKMELTTAEGKSLAGNVAVNIKTAANSEYTCTYPSDKKVTYTFPENTVIASTKYLTFTVYALPEDIEGLTLKFYMGNGTTTTATLKTKATTSTPSGPITFAGGKKHCLRGIAIPGGWKFLTLDITVKEWIELEIEQSNGSGVQATQFAVDGADNLRELKDAVDKVDANKDYRQCWLFTKNTETGANNPITVTYKIMMPTSGTWAIEKLGDTSDFTVSVTSSVGTVTTEGNKYRGALATSGSTYITITINSSATALKKLYFKTTVSNGTTNFSLDSETQLYDMRGYHYFIVNGTAATTFDDLNI